MNGALEAPFVDTICLVLQAPVFHRVMCTGESDSTETHPPKSVSDQIIWPGRLRVNGKNKAMRNFL